MISFQQQTTDEDGEFCNRIKLGRFRIQGLWVEYYSPTQSLIIVENDEVYRVDSTNYKMDEWVNVGLSPEFGWREYCYSPDMAKLRHHLTFQLLYVHQVRMHYVFQDMNLMVSTSTNS